ncbi:MAG TPA: polysaccharide pyruvyl transferase family protein [Noviherbaspirillum sp.]
MNASTAPDIPIILFGAFDRHNFGDLLFPHVLAALRGRDRLVFAGLAERDLRPFGGHQVHALASLASQWRDRRVHIVHAGGELLACDAWEAAVMLLPPEQAAAAIARFEAHPGGRNAWAQQMLGLAARAPYTVPRALFPHAAGILYNAVGGMDLDARDPALRDEVMVRLREADAVGVRDTLTRAQLAAAGIDCLLLPDSAMMVAALFGDRIRGHAMAGEVAHLVRTCPDGYLAVQFSVEFGDDSTIDAIAAQLDLVTAATGCAVVFFRAGAAPWHDDLSCYIRTAARMRAGSAHVFASLDIWDICALIAASSAYIGSSLHGRIVAMAFALPRVNLHPPWHVRGPTKASAYAATWEVPGTPASVGVQDVAGGVRQAMAADRNTLARTAARLAEAYRQGFASLFAHLA